jgi:hypothetical protein
MEDIGQLHAPVALPTGEEPHKCRRIEWLGHVLRMESSTVPQKVLDGRPEGKRSIGRPRLRWLDDVVSDLRNMGVG